jgi:acyl-ACP thioesterase
MLESEHAVEELPPKLAIGDELEPVDGRVARYSDLDVNRHVNNARYVDWIFDAVPPPDEASVAFSNLAVQFSGEARFGETVDILTGTADGAGLCHAAIVTRDARTHVCDATVTPARD